MGPDFCQIVDSPERRQHGNKVALGHVNRLQDRPSLRVFKKILITDFESSHI